MTWEQFVAWVKTQRNTGNPAAELVISLLDLAESGAGAKVPAPSAKVKKAAPADKPTA